MIFLEHKHTNYSLHEVPTETKASKKNYLFYVFQ